MGSNSDTLTKPAVVVATYSRQMNLRLRSGDIVRARIKGKKLKPVCGDRVQAQPLENEAEWLITAIDDRSNALTRPNLRGQTEILAANLQYLCVVAASKPAPDWFIVDRYLCAAELMNVDAAVIYNKVDLDSDVLSSMSLSWLPASSPSVVSVPVTGDATLVANRHTAMKWEAIRTRLQNLRWWSPLTAAR